MKECLLSLIFLVFSLRGIGQLLSTLTSFEGKRPDNQNVLTWKVEDEMSFDRYVIERSTDGRNFNSITTISATAKSAYIYSDGDINNQPPGFYYRLKMIEKDGRSSLSFVVKVKNQAVNWHVSATPNPFVNSMRVTVESSVKGNLPSFYQTRQEEV